MKDKQYTEFVQRLRASGIHNAQQELIWLSCYALKLSVPEFLSRKIRSGYAGDFLPREISLIDALVSRREAGEPLQYIIGEADFYGRDFSVGPGVLIPRHDTEVLIRAAFELVPLKDEKEFFFVDWGTGSGCIAATLLIEYKKSFAFMIENSQEARSYAEKNLARYGLENRARFFNAFEPVICDCELFISNPPYIPAEDISGLMPTVRDYEPRSALDGGEEGMDFYKIIFQQAKSALHEGGYLVLEIGTFNQAKALKNFMKEFKFVKEFFDDGDFPRCMAWKLTHESENESEN